MTWRIGLVGAGMIAPIHRDAIAAIADAELVGIMDNGSGRGRALAPDLDATGADDLDAFVARDDIDVVAIASPSGAHRDAALRAARAGKHCIVEKPMETTPARIDEMIAAHREAGTVLGGIFNTRYTEGAQLLRRAVEQGRFGRITFASAVGPWWRDQAYYDSSEWRGTWALDGGGALMNQGIHSVDLLQWVVGSPVRSVSARTATLAHDRVEVEDTGAACLEFDNGALGTIGCTTSMWPGHFRTITVAGDAGTAVLGDGDLLFWQFRDETADDDAIRAARLRLPGAGVGASNPSAGIDPRGHQRAYEEFLQAVRAGTTPVVDGHEARKAVAIICAIYESARRGGAAVAVEHGQSAR
ncbi:MAG: Gfo/Idh/MocA family oxidoreductase [Ectothiorhodospiraceae bacterium]|nr:Gfo/Idh/MocA family oxidoreductase [Chromatiales bacterium]MCP5154433.1 Gfo/Idh/MocA family oxidoreductase [Ectothiorhodospiraceae bacterium]